MKKRTKGLIISIILINLFIGSIVFATNGSKMIEVIFNSVNLIINGEAVEVDNLKYNGVTYAPVRDVAEMLGKEVGWEEDTNTVSILDKQPFTIGENFVLHGFYALGAYSQYSDFNRSRTLSNFDSISFGWSRIDKKDDEVQLLLSAKNSRDFYVPSGYNEALDIADTYNISKQLMIFAEDYFSEIFDEKETLVEQIVEVANGENETFSMLEFNGVTIDFEFVNKEDQEGFVEFLELLKVKLEDKMLYVAIPPINNYNHYLFEDIVATVDYMIIMEHDFDDKQLQPGYAGDNVVKTPLSPIEKIESDINFLISRVGQDNADKILLQLSFGATQWGVKNGYLHSSSTNSEVIKPYNPSYELIYDRINKEINEKNMELSDLIVYDEEYHNPYVRYYNDEQEIQYYTWFENSRSILEKIKLAQKYDLAGISLWRIGSIPNYYGENGKEAGMDVWNEISDLINR